MADTEYPPRFVSAFVSRKLNAIELRRVESGGYDCSNPAELSELIAAIVAAKQAVSHWSMWDDTDGAPTEKRTTPYSAADFRKLLSGEDVALIWARRGGFRAPVLKIGNIDRKKPAAGKRPVSKRIGK